MSNSPESYIAQVSSNAADMPVRVAFITRRTSPAVKVDREEQLLTHPGGLLRVAVAVELLAILLVIVSLVWNAPLEELADPTHTPNPAKAPWYFLGLQELLHYFPPVVAGVLIPGLVILALIVVPYFHVNIKGEGLFLNKRAQRANIFGLVVVVFSAFLAIYHVWVALVPTLIMAAFMFVAACRAGKPVPRPGRGLAAKPLSFWIMTWFMVELIVLTVVGTFFRGPGWSWVLPWRPY